MLDLSNSFWGSWPEAIYRLYRSTSSWKYFSTSSGEAWFKRKSYPSYKMLYLWKSRGNPMCIQWIPVNQIPSLFMKPSGNRSHGWQWKIPYKWMFLARNITYGPMVHFPARHVWWNFILETLFYPIKYHLLQFARILEILSWTSPWEVNLCGIQLGFPL